ncbi:MAG: NAD-dependent epimerase/dehydratase family protein, partial [Mycobacterium sp.]
MRVLVTGVSGLVGRTAAARFAGRGDEVVGFSRTAPLELPTGVSFVRGDVLDPDALARAFATFDGIDLLVHSAFALDSREGVEQMRRVNVDGTANVIAAAEAAGVKRAIFMSSVTVYGPRVDPEQTASTEARQLTPHPQHPYALHKVECERLFGQSSLPSVLVRAGIVLGRGTDHRLREALAARRHMVSTGPQYPWGVIHH